MSELYRQLPAVDALLAHPLLVGLPHGVAVAVIRAVLAEKRAAIAAGDVPEFQDLPAQIAARAEVLVRGRLRAVINATGIPLHTNLGRAPWAPEAITAASAVAAGYCDLELDRGTGERGGRGEGVHALLQHLCGAPAALVVNNGAAAVLLAMTALAQHREVIVSRGELVEIGGSFRVPDVIASGGARLREVGTTNRTRLSDYAQAITPETAAFLVVHPSNFRMVGFTERVDRRDLVTLAKAHQLRVIEDLGSGSLDGERDEPSIREAMAAGVHLAAFSGDKLLGGPQAGILIGDADVIAICRKHPLYRALRVDKVTLAALEATLVLHAAHRPTPLQQLIDATVTQLEARAQRLADRLSSQGISSSVSADKTFVGGGSWPGQELPTVVVLLAVPRPDDLVAALRRGDLPVIARITRDRVALDVRALSDDWVDVLADRVASAMRKGY